MRGWARRPQHSFLRSSESFPETVTSLREARNEASERAIVMRNDAVHICSLPVLSCPVLSRPGREYQTKSAGSKIVNYEMKWFPEPDPPPQPLVNKTTLPPVP